MTPTKATLCLVSPMHLANNPRLIKEADTFHDAGYRVTVVSGRNDPTVDAADRDLEQAAGWEHRKVDFTRRAGTLPTEAIHRVARFFARISPRSALGPALAAHAHHRASRQLAASAALTRADLYLGHTVAGLAAAGQAARIHETRLGFDAEDFHAAETSEAVGDPILRSTIAAIERSWLPRCVHLTAASPLIAQAYAEAFQIRIPVTLLNVFPRSMAPPGPPAVNVGTGPRRLYWYSQTIGPGRGLERLVATLARACTPSQLTLRGRADGGFVGQLRDLAHAQGFAGTIESLPVGPPRELARLCVGYDLGLAIEESVPRNRDLCLTNKIFTYLLAGLPVALSPTRAQRALATDLGEAGLLLDLTAPAEAAAALDQWFTNSQSVARARAQAWHLGTRRFNWDLERTVLLEALRESLARPAPSLRSPARSSASSSSHP